MAGCGCQTPKFDGLDERYRRILLLVIALNFGMFIIEASAGMLAGSMALRADALDFLGDSLTYGLTLFIIGWPLVWRARVALLKGVSLAVLGLWVLIETAYRVLILGQPNEFVMGAIGLMALATNLTAAGLLARYRDGDANVRSVWLCSRNDAIGNIAVMAAAGGVWATGTPWPDLVVAGLMASVFLISATQIIAAARTEQRQSA